MKVNGPAELASKVFSDLNKEAAEKLDYYGLGLWVDETEGYTNGAFRGIKSYAVGTPDGKNVASISGIKKESQVEIMMDLTLEEFSNYTEDLYIPTTRRTLADISEGYSDPFGAKTVYAIRNINIRF
jgi:hypothetical protein